MPPGPLPLAPLGHPGGLPLRRSACSGQKRFAAHIRPPPLALPPSGSGSLVARRGPRPGLAPGSAGRSPSGSPPALWLRLSGAAPPALRGPPAPRRPRCGPSCGSSRLGPARFARGASGRPWAAPGVALRAAAGSLCPRGLLAASGPPWGPGLRPAALRLPSGLPPGASGGPCGPLSQAPGPGRLGALGPPPIRRVCARCGGRLAYKADRLSADPGSAGTGIHATRCALASPQPAASLSASAYKSVTSGRSCISAR